MRPSFAHTPAPLLVCVVRDNTVEAAVATVTNGELDGAGAFDLHISKLPLECQNAEALAPVFAGTRLPVLALFYKQGPRNEAIEIDDETRTRITVEAVRAGAAGIDMEAYRFDADPKASLAGSALAFAKYAPADISLRPDAVARQREIIAEVHALGGEVLMSCHTGVHMPADAVVALAREMASRGADIVKLVAPCGSEAQLTEGLATMTALHEAQLGVPFHLHLSGPIGYRSRLVAPMFGSHLIFCNDRYGPYAHAEQPPLRPLAAFYGAFRGRL